jgi:hypothetical protein
MCSTACLLADRAETARPALFFELALALLATAPGAGKLPADTDRTHHLEEAGAAAFAMLGQAPLQVLAGVQVVLRVLVGSIKVWSKYTTMCLSFWERDADPLPARGYLPLQ